MRRSSSLSTDHPSVEGQLTKNHLDRMTLLQRCTCHLAATMASLTLTSSSKMRSSSNISRLRSVSRISAQRMKECCRLTQALGKNVSCNRRSSTLRFRDTHKTQVTSYTNGLIEDLNSIEEAHDQVRITDVLIETRTAT